MTHNQEKKLSFSYKGYQQAVDGLIDRCIPEACKSSQHELMRSRVLVLILLSLTILLTVLHGILSGFIDFTPEGGALSRRVILGLGIGSLLTLVTFHFFKRREAASHLLALIIWGTLVQTCAFTGGIESPCLALFIVIPVFVGLTGGTSGGVYWALLVCATWVLMLSLYNNGFEFTQQVAEKNFFVAQAVCMMLTCFLVISGVVQYEVINYQLRSALAQERESFEYLARHDQLTGLPNRRHFLTEMDMVIRRAERTGKRAGLIFIDLDDFKPVNDHYGHNAGDQVLQTIATRLLQNLRATDHVARWGGDEFAVIVEHLEAVDDLKQVSAKLKHAVSQPIHIQGNEVSVGASMGSAVFPDHAMNAASLEKLADAAMYAEKSERRRTTYSASGQISRSDVANSSTDNLGVSPST